MRFIRPEDVNGSDEVLVDAVGKPVVMMGAPGRRKKGERSPEEARVAYINARKRIEAEDTVLLESLRAENERLRELLASGVVLGSAFWDIFPANRKVTIVLEPMETD